MKRFKIKMPIYIPAIFFLSLCAYVLLAWGFSIQDFVVMFFASILLFGVAIYTATQGVQELNNFVTVIFTAVNFGLGSYFILRSIYEFLILPYL